MLSDGCLDARMDRLPDAEVHAHYPRCLGRIGRVRNGDVEAIAPVLRSDESNVPQEILQIAEEAWSIDGDVQAAKTLRGCRNGVALSHFRQEMKRVKSASATSSISSTSRR